MRLGMIQTGRGSSRVGLIAQSLARESRTGAFPVSPVASNNATPETSSAWATRRIKPISGSIRPASISCRSKRGACASFARDRRDSPRFSRSRRRFCASAAFISLGFSIDCPQTEDRVSQLGKDLSVWRRLLKDKGNCRIDVGSLLRPAEKGRWSLAPTKH
jgi:hypothetical protein